MLGQLALDLGQRVHAFAPAAPRYVAGYARQQRLDVLGQVPLLRLAEELEEHLLGNVFAQARGRRQPHGQRPHKALVGGEQLIDGVGRFRLHGTILISHISRSNVTAKFRSPRLPRIPR